MFKKLTIVIGVLLLSGCSLFETKPIACETVERKVPILYCPAPPEVIRPTLSIHTMTEEQKKNAGEVAKHWKATAIELMGYSKELEIGLGKYKDINMSYDELKRKMESVEQ